MNCRKIFKKLVENYHNVFKTKRRQSHSDRKSVNVDGNRDQEVINEEVRRVGAELVIELSKATPEDYLQMKLMMLAAVRQPKVEVFLQRVFTLAEERRPLLIEMK